MSASETPVAHDPMTVRSRGRIYLTSGQRHRLGIERFGHGSTINVGVVTTSSKTEDGHSVGAYATFTVQLCEYGEFTIPSTVRDAIDVDVGDTVLLTVYGVDTADTGVTAESANQTHDRTVEA